MQCSSQEDSLWPLTESTCILEVLTNAMVNVGMQVSKLDPCTFVGDKVISLAFVDDILFWSTDDAY